jgi:lipopolysaccharide/colanic/teichoic acid biosynthesis glycosyltransferase
MSVYSRAGKRLFDLTIGSLLAILTLPVQMIVGVLVKLRLGSPVVFSQVRPGRGGKPFAIRKFRTMTDERGPDGQLLPDADRLPAFGQFLRSTSLDELPELLNVVKGDMSLVGPRPLLMSYLPRYNARQARRHEVRPGLTGLAQVSGRNGLSWEEKLELDAWYVDHVSFALDMRILWRTLTSVIRRDGISSVDHATMPTFMGSPPDESSPGR